MKRSSRHRQLNTYLLIVMAGVQELFAQHFKRAYGRLRLLNSVLWIVGGIWLITVFS